MKKMKILLPTDCSDFSQKAIQHALKMNEFFQAELYFFHSVIIMGVQENMVRKLFDILAKEASEEVKQMVDNIQMQSQTDFTYKIVIAHGNPVNEINSFVDLNAIDLIIMGSKGTSGVKKAIMGSNAAKIALNPPCPVMIIPEKAEINTKISDIVYATDLTELKNEMGTAVAISRLFDAQLHVLHIYPENLSLMEFDIEGITLELTRKYNYEKISFEAIMDNNIINGLHYYAKINEPGMLMLYRHQKETAERIFDPDISKEYAYAAELPLLIIPQEVEKNDTQ